MHVGERIILLREKKGWKQKDLAEKVDINSSVMNRIEKGTRPLVDEEIKKIAVALGVTTDYLLGYQPLSRAERSNQQNNDVVLTEKDEVKTADSFNFLSELNKLIVENGIEDAGFFDIEEWKNLSAEDMIEIQKHFEWVAQKAKERNTTKK
ncbi:helix-turn-helix transcriptional regulator [Metabacillus fastidiosus]|uniref:helix-turn-helix domain-containing protein n=1 Tax=Metabacillus fastidiosus TaxID=1458 RepID=UPI002E1E01A0|nr:helix-turn-helix transcriptional regulator [Metabacillus fastidiosus]